MNFQSSFQFLLQLTGSMGQLQLDTPEADRQLNIPGISHGVHSMMDLLMKLPAPISLDQDTVTSDLPESIDDRSRASSVPVSRVTFVPDPSDADLETNVHHMDDISAANLIINAIEPKLADLDDIIDSPDQKKKLMKLLVESLIILQAAEDNQQSDRSP